MAAGTTNAPIGPLPGTAASTPTAIVFARLDPILKRLLEGLTSLKTLLPMLPSSSGKEKVIGEKDGREATFVRLVKSIGNDLETLSRGMRLETGSVQPDQSNEQKRRQFYQRLQHAKALCLLTKYIKLPLTVVFHLPLKEIYALSGHSNNGNDNKQSEREEATSQLQSGDLDTQRYQKLKIRRSYVFRLYRSTAIAIRTFMEETTINNSHVPDAIPSLSAGTGYQNLLQNNTWIEFMVALIHSMPTYSERNKMPSSQSFMASSPSSSLDDGSDAWIAILDATKILLLCFDNSDRTDSNAGRDPEDPVTELLVEAWHGTLSMRLVDCLTAFLSVSQHGAFSSRVHIAALRTLVSLLRITAPFLKSDGTTIYSGSTTSRSRSSSRAFWRSVFPGVFAALFQRIVNDASGNRSKTLPSSPIATPDTIQIKRFALEALIMLLRITLSPKSSSSSESVRPMNEKINKTDNVDTHVALDTHSTSLSPQPNNGANNNDLLAKLNSMVIAADSSNKSSQAQTPTIVTSEKEKEKNKQEQDEKMFRDQVRKRVEGPLVFVLRQLSVSSSDAIRGDVVTLCRTILFETRHCWASPSSGEGTGRKNTSSATDAASPAPKIVLEQLPLELCIGFQQDPNASVRASAREIVNTYIEIGHGDPTSSLSSSMPSPSDWMVPRMIELIQKLSALVFRGDKGMDNMGNGIRSGRNSVTTTTELRTELNLLAGYVHCLNTSCHTISSNGNKQNERTKNDAKELKAINRSMCNAIVSSKHIRRGLIRKFEKALWCKLLPIFLIALSTATFGYESTNEWLLYTVITFALYHLFIRQNFLTSIWIQ